MSTRVFESGRSLRNWVFIFSVRNAVIALGGALGYVFSVVRFSDQQLTVVISGMVGVVFVGIAVGYWTIAFSLKPLEVYLDEGPGGAAATRDPETVASAFRCVMDLPRLLFCTGVGLWLGSGTLLCAVMQLGIEGLTNFSMFSVMMGALAGGVISQIFAFVWLKEKLSELREEIAFQIQDPQARDELIRHVSIGTKLSVSVLGILLAAVAFSLSVAQVRSDERGDREWFDLASGILEKIEVEVAAGVLLEESIADATSWLPRESIEISLIPLESPGASSLLVTGVSASEMREILLRNGPGTSHDFNARGRFLWRELADRRVLVSLPRAYSAASLGRILGDYSVMIVVGSSLALLLGIFAGRELSRTGEALGREVRRIAGGDLRKGRVFESEDEFGGLSRSVYRMADSLTETVQNIRLVAEEMDAATRQIASATEGVAGVTEAQVAGLDHASSLMQNITMQVADIAENATSLDMAMEISSQAIRSIESESVILTQSSETLTGKISEVATSINQMSTSIRSVGDQADALGESATAVTTRMEEISEAVKQVDTNASETAQLAEGVVEAATVGQRNFGRITDGIDAIRDATQTTDRVIQSLVFQTEKIGSIVDVISNVADETGLLALNAAIIAAQSGEQGRSFKVVAERVKELSRRVIQSTGEIGELISAVQTESDNAVRAIHDSSTSVDEGTRLCVDAAGSLESIDAAARESGERTARIVSGIREHRNATAEVGASMGSVNEGVAQIRRAGQEQKLASVVVLRSSSAMEEIASGVLDSASQQSQSVIEIGESTRRALESMTDITNALERQNDACYAATKQLAEVRDRTRINEEATGQLTRAVQQIILQAQKLRQDVDRFVL